jgi:hypothetical protein
VHIAALMVQLFASGRSAGSPRDALDAACGPKIPPVLSVLGCTIESVSDKDLIPEPEGEDGDDEIVDEATLRRAEEIQRDAEEAVRQIPPIVFEAAKWHERNNGLYQLMGKGSLAELKRNSAVYQFMQGNALDEIRRNNGLHEIVQRQALETTRLLKWHRDLLQHTSMPTDFRYFADLLETLPKPTVGLEAVMRSTSADLEMLLRPSLLEQQLSALLSNTLVSLGNAPGLAGLHRLPRLLYPANWGTLADDPDDVDTAVSIMRDEGIPLAWVPGPAIVAELVAAPDAATRTVILENRAAEITTDCLAALDQVTDPDLKHLAELTRQSIAALDKTPEAGQALAANVFDTFLRHANQRGRMFGASFGYFKYKEVTTRITPVQNVTTAAELRVACALTPALCALTEFHPGTGSIPAEFNRHATAHAADPAQYTRANAVTAVMLATSFLRQAQESGW